jgi:hypothetical protein
LFRETWTSGDPERENIKLFPVEMRRPFIHRATCIDR